MLIDRTAFLAPGSGRRFAKVIRGRFCNASKALLPVFFVKDMFQTLTCQRLPNQGHDGHVTEVTAEVLGSATISIHIKIKAPFPM